MRVERHKVAASDHRQVSRFGVWYLIKTAPPDPTDFGTPIHIHTLIKTVEARNSAP